MDIKIYLKIIVSQCSGLGSTFHKITQTLEKSMKFSHQIEIPHRSFFAVWMQQYAFHFSRLRFVSGGYNNASRTLTFVKVTSSTSQKSTWRGLVIQPIGVYEITCAACAPLYRGRVLVLIRFWIWIQDQFYTFFNITRYGILRYSNWWIFHSCGAQICVPISNTVQFVQHLQQLDSRCQFLYAQWFDCNV